MSAQPNALENRLDMLDSQLAQLLSTVEKGFSGAKADTEDVLGVLDAMTSRIDERFREDERSATKLQTALHNIQNQLDSIEKRLEISDDERLVMAHQLTQLHDWVERAAKRIDIEFVH